MNEFLQRLKERKLVQWTLAYVAAAFALLQGVDIVASRFGWPEQTMRLVIIALSIGFFVTLLLAWYHGERGAQRVTGTELLILALLLIIGGGFLWRFTGTSGKPVIMSASLVDSTATLAPPAAIPEKSIAVLPLLNEGGEKDEQYFSDGLSEDLITALSQFSGLKVIGRNSSFQFRGSKDDSKTIGAKLGVAHLLEGSVRRAADAVRISAELINAADGTTLWSEKFDRPYKDLFKLQDDITSAVAEALKTKLLHPSDAATQSDRPPSGDLGAYNAFLQGQFYNQRNTQADYRKAIESFQTAIGLDPQYARAYTGLAGAELFLTDFSGGTQAQQGLAAARVAVNKALALNPNLAAAHGARGLLSIFDIDLTGAESEFKQAARLAPNDLDIRASLAEVQASLGRPEAAIEPIRQTLAADPRSNGWYSLLANDLMALGRLDEAERTTQEQIALQASDGAKARLSYIEVLRGNAAAALAKAEQVPPGKSRDLALANARQIGHDQVAADAALKNLIDHYGESDPYLISRCYALRNDPAKTFEWLERAWSNRDNNITILYYDPFLLLYKDDPRFAALCKKMGLPTPAEVATATKS
jgi:TolB-like protein/Tfp pilus assembly protein PilF